MSVQKILYDDKQTFQVSERPEEEKATAANYNEIKDVVNFNADTLDNISAGTWIPALTTGDVSAIQNTVTSDISGQTGTKTFDGINWDITTSGRTSTGEVNFLNFKKDTVSTFKVNVDGLITVATGTNAGIAFGDGDTSIFENVDDRLFIKISGTTNWEIRQGKFSAFTGTGGASIKPNVGSVTLPAHTYRGDEDSGDRWVSANVIQTVTGGIAVVTYDASQNLIMENGKFFSVASTTLAAITIGSFAGDPSGLINGDEWYNSSTEKFRGRQNGVSVDMVGGGDVTKVGTPVNNQLGVWTGDGTIEGTTNLTWDDSSFIIKNGSLRQLTYNNGTGTLDLTQTVAGDDLILDIKNEVTNVANHASINIAVNTGGGDAYTSYSDVGTFSFAMGVDNSDSDIFKVTSSTSVLATPSVGTEIMSFSPAGGWSLFGVAPATQQAHVADPTGGATVDAECRTAVNSILAQLATYGIQASS